MRSMGRSMNWTLEDNMVYGLVFCATLAGRRWRHTPFVQTEAETPNTSEQVVKLVPGFVWEVLSPGNGCRCQDLKWGVLWGCPPTPHAIGDPPNPLHVCCCCLQKNWWVDVRRVQMGVSIWCAVHVHSVDGWALSGADVQAPWHGGLEIVWLECDEPQ